MIRLAVLAALLLLVFAVPVVAQQTPIEEDYGVLTLPPDALTPDLAQWNACSREEQDIARGALALEYSPGAFFHRSYITDGGEHDHAEVHCLEALLRVMGARVVSVEPNRRLDGQVTTGLHKTWRGWVEHRPGGWWVSWSGRHDGCRVTIWGVLGPPQKSAPWYLAYAPASATTCPTFQLE